MQTSKYKPFIIVMVITVALLLLMKAMKKEIETKENTHIIPAVEVVQIEPIDFVVPIRSEGLVVPKTRINLSAELSGRVVEVADDFNAGGRFKKGDVLLKIDPVDYQLAITRANANVAAQQANLDLQQAKSDLAKKDWKKYGKKGKPDALNLNLPQVASAKAALSGALADLNLAKRNLEKTSIVAPFDGVILSKNVDVGQFVTLATVIASVASTQQAEIRIALTDVQLQNSGINDLESIIDISAVIKSEEITATQWQAKVARIESQRDAKTLLNYVVIEIESPFSQQNKALRFNTFVSVTLKGKTLKQVYPIERGFVMLDDKVKILDEKSKLEIRQVEIAYSDSAYYYISDGIKQDDRVITTGLAHVKSGDLLKLVEMK